MQVAFGTYCVGRGMRGSSIIRDIQPKDLGLTMQQISIPADEASYTIERELKEDCAMVIGGWIVNDSVIREVDVWKAEHKLYWWELRKNVHTSKHDGMVPHQYIMWARGDLLKLVFFPMSTSSAVQISKTWLFGLVDVPQRNMSCTNSINAKKFKPVKQI